MLSDFPLGSGLISNAGDVVNFTPEIVVFGIGGAGGNAVTNMINTGLEGVKFVVANTDAQSVSLSPCKNKIQLGKTITSGLGAGSIPEIGKKSALENKDEIISYISKANILFITAGMGGGTGTGAAPVVAQMAKELGILTVAVVTKPFNFEGHQRMVTAEDGIADLEKHVDTIIIISNQNLFRIANESTSFSEAFKIADDVLYSGVKCITDLITMPGLINLDFADVKTVISNMGRAMIGTGEASGSDRAMVAVEMAITNPLLENVSISGAHGLLINITGWSDMTLFEVNDIVNRICEKMDKNTKLIFGAIFDESLGGRIRVSVVATGVGEQGNKVLRQLRSDDMALKQNVAVGHEKIHDVAPQRIQMEQHTSKERRVNNASVRSDNFYHDELPGISIKYNTSDENMEDDMLRFVNDDFVASKTTTLNNKDALSILGRRSTPSRHQDEQNNDNHDNRNDNNDKIHMSDNVIQDDTYDTYQEDLDGYNDLQSNQRGMMNDNQISQQRTATMSSPKYHPRANQDSSAHDLRLFQRISNAFGKKKSNSDI